MTVDMDVKRVDVLMLMRDRMIDDVGLINDLLEPKELSQVADIPSYKMGERGQIILVYLSCLTAGRGMRILIGLFIKYRMNTVKTL